MRKILRRYLPHRESVKNNRWLKPFGSWLHHPGLWHLHRRSVAGGVAAGLFCGLIPGPLQMIGAAIVAVLFRVNLPVALFTTLYTNPFTIVPLYLTAYELGCLISGVPSAWRSAPELGLQWGDLLDWLMQLGKPLLIGLPVLAVVLSVSGYLLVRLIWRLLVVWKWRKRV